MSKRFKRCIIHIGTEKTGSSTLQNFLAFNRQELLTDGILFPTYFNSGQGSQWEYVAASIPAPWLQDVGEAFKITNQEDHIQFLGALTENLKGQFAKNTRAETLLISSEHFHSRLNMQDMVQRLMDFLDPWVEEFKIIVYFRRQDELARSHFSTRIKSGYQGDDPILPVAGKLHSYFQYDALMSRWGNVFGEQALMVGLYPDIMASEGTIIYDFCRKCKIQLLRKTIPDHVNHSVNAAGLKFIQTMNMVLKDSPSNPKDKDIKNEIIGLITELFPGPMYVLDKKTAKALVELFEEGNEAIRKKYFADSPAPLFSNNFDFYPDMAEEFVADYVQAVQIALKIWEHKSSTSQSSFLSKMFQYTKQCILSLRS